MFKKFWSHDQDSHIVKTKNQNNKSHWPFALVCLIRDVCPTFGFYLNDDPMLTLTYFKAR